ncbi:MAG: hypothetical protein WBB74_10540 [Gaiellaceae bacterium]
MTERGDDIEFDFFDEPETREAAPPERPMRRGRPRPPVRPPTGLTPLLRLVGVISFAILIVVLLVFWAQSCSASSKHDKYAGYMSKVSQLASHSQQTGRQLNDLLTTPGLKQADLQSRLAGLARQAELDVQQARSINPPGRLRDENQRLIEALEFRVSGLTGLADTFRRTANTKNASGAGALLAQQADRLVASDVVWDDNFRVPSMQVLKGQGVGDVRVPEAHFLSNPELASQRSMTGILQRLGGAAQVKPGGLHGTQLISVKVLPRGDVLSTSTLNTIVASSNLAFAVTVQDSGNSSEVRIPVTVTIQQAQPIVKRATIDFISPGEQKTLTFTGVGAPTFAKQTTLKVSVQPVPHETNVSNNSASYPVIFTLG